MRHLRSFTLAVVAASFPLIACHPDTAPPVQHKQPVVVERARKIDLPIQLHYPAELQAIQQADVQPMEIRGYVTKMFVDKGDVVKAGQVLARLDCTPYADERARLEEAARQAQARRDFAAETAARLTPMAAQNFIGAQDLEQAKSELATSSAALATAQAAVTEMNHKLSYCELTAPFSGSITMRYVDPGALVGPGNPVVSMVDSSEMRVFVNVVERDSGKVAVGQLGTLTVDAYPGRVFKGRVQRIVAALDPKTRTMLVEVDIPNRDGALKPGMFGRLAITVDVHRGAIVAPARALIVNEEGAWAFVARGDVARRVKLALGYDDGDRVEVLSGLSATDAVVVAGQDLLGDGALIEPHFESEPEADTVPQLVASKNQAAR